MPIGLSNRRKLYTNILSQTSGDENITRPTVFTNRILHKCYFHFWRKSFPEINFDKLLKHRQKDKIISISYNNLARFCWLEWVIKIFVVYEIILCHKITSFWRNNVTFFFSKNVIIVFIADAFRKQFIIH